MRYDKEGNAIHLYDSVIVDDPREGNENDDWRWMFSGTVEGFSNGFVEVSDCDENYWMVEDKCLTIDKG